MRNNASLIYGFFLVIGDFLALIAAFAGAYYLRVKLDDRPLHVQGLSGEDYIITLLFLIPFWLIVFGLVGLYNRTTYENRFSEFGRLAVGSFVGILFLISYGYITETDVFPTRLVTAYALLLAFLLLLLFRTIARAVRRSLFSFGVGVSNVLIIGDTPITKHFIEGLSHTKATGYRVIGIVGSKNMGKEYPHFSSFAAAVKALDKIGIHSIMQTELYNDPAKNSEVLTHAQENHIGYRFIPGNGELLSGNIEVDLFNSVPVIAVHQTALTGWGRIVKRLFDIIVSFMAIVILSPIMLLIYLALLVTGGKAIYTRKRLTRFGHSFKIYKFRSLKTAYTGMDPEEGFTKMGRPELIKQFRDNGDFLEHDPRIARVGRFLRTTSLDELPQLFNILKGDISLVGPRALIPEELEAYKQKHAILSVKSGLTGLAVISGRKDIPFDERRRLDLYYVQNWSFWGDIVILLKSVVVVLFGRGAR